MERQDVSEGSGRPSGCFDLDLPQLGNGTQETEAHDGSRTSASAVRTKKKQILNEAQKERKRAWTRARYQELKDKKRKGALDFYYANREKVLAQKKARRDSIPGFNQTWYRGRKEKYKVYTVKWRQENPEKWKELQEGYKARRNQLNKLRRSENPHRKLIENLRTRLYALVKRNSPKLRNHTLDFLGCTPAFFRDYLQAQFDPIMAWNNYGTYWNIDHRIPLAAFDLSDPEKVKQAFHYSNCRPLTCAQNNSKSNSLPGPHQPLLC